MRKPLAALYLTLFATFATSAPFATSALADETPSPPYDLAADREAMKSAARSELGAGVSTFVVGDTFVLVGAPDWSGGAFADSASLVRSALAAFFHGRFRKGPERAISVYLFSGARTYGAYCTGHFHQPCISVYGFYWPDERKLVMNAGLGLGTLTHELVHPIVEADFPRAPIWINEGIASLFEAPLLGQPGEIHGAKNWRHPRLVAGLGAKGAKAARLEQLFGMSDERFRDGDEDLHYAMARYLCQWLDGQGKLWPFYQRWRDGVDEDATGEKTFAAVVGKAPSEAHAGWARWVRAL